MSKNATTGSLSEPTWGRVALNGKSEAEHLLVPQAVKAAQWNPTYCLPTPDGNGLIVGDGQYLVLLRFE